MIVKIQSKARKDGKRKARYYFDNGRYYNKLLTPYDVELLQREQAAGWPTQVIIVSKINW